MVDMEHRMLRYLESLERLCLLDLFKTLKVWLNNVVRNYVKSIVWVKTNITPKK